MDATVTQVDPLPYRGTISDAAAPCETPQTGTAASCVSAVFRQHRWRVAFTYVLFNIENAIRLSQPWFLGLAVNDLLAGRTTGLILCLIQHALSVAICTARQLYDTRCFTRLYADLATRLAVEQRRGGVDLSRIAARSALSREVVDFFERDVPFLFHALYSVIGALVMITVYDGILIIPCLLFLAAAGLLSRSLARKALNLNGGLNDQIEREVNVLQHGSSERVEHHYHQLRGWRIRLCNVQALTFGFLELLALVLLGIVLVRGCSAGGSAGSLFALLGYVVMLTTSLVNLPQWIQQLSRLRDIRRRLHRIEASP